MRASFFCSFVTVLAVVVTVGPSVFAAPSGESLKRRRTTTAVPATGEGTTAHPDVGSSDDVAFDIDNEVDSLLNPKPIVSKAWSTFSQNGSSLILFDEYLHKRFNDSAKRDGTSMPIDTFNNVTSFVNEHFRLLYHYLYDLNNYINNIKYNTRVYGQSICETSDCDAPTRHAQLPECPAPGWNVPMGQACAAVPS